MYTREKLYREENYISSRRNHKDIPSFSSTLLDEIYRSIDGNAEKSEDFKAYKEKSSKKQSATISMAKKFASIEDEGLSSFTRTCFVEKWMEKEKFAAKTKSSSLQDFDNKSLQDNDLVFFSSTSSSSDSSGALSSSDTEFFSSTTTKPKVSCFSARPKPVRTGFSFDDHKNFDKNKVEDDLIKSKSRALKIYANLKKVKQPISPGGRLTSFINSLFSNANGKKSKNLDSNKVDQDLKSPKAASTCSSASSFSRSCLSKYSPKSREKMRNGAAQRTVRFDPVSVIVDEDARPCGHKSIYDEDGQKYGRPPLPPTALAEVKLSKVEKNRKVEEGALKGYNNSKRVDEFSLFRKIHDRDHEDEDEDEEDDDDCLSDSSSDLFELDHLALFGDNRFCEELPVYETTYFDTNRAIASGLIR